MAEGSAEQRCRQCGEVKPLEAFNWANRAKGRRQGMCRACFSDYNRARYLEKGAHIRATVNAYQTRNRDEVSRKKRTRYWRDIEASRARERARARVNNAKPERQAAKIAWARADRKTNPEKWREKSRRDYYRSPEARRQLHHRRRARKLATVIGPVTLALLASKWSYWAGLCWMCGCDAGEWDHVKPLSKGGSHMLCNLRPACVACNRRKAASWPLAV